MLPIQKLIEDDLALKEAEPRERSGKFSPSSFGRCFRYQIWNRKDLPKEPIDSRTLRVFECGHIFENYVVDRVKKVHNGSLQTQVLIEEEDIKGYADLVVEDEVCDVKSIHSRAFWYMDKEEFDVTVDKKPNILQVVYYANRLDKKNASLCFISKDDLCIKQYIFDTKKWSDVLDDELKRLRHYWATNELPDATPRAYMNKSTGKFKECGYCPFSKLCKETEEKAGRKWKN
jgi:hypothetical protein